MSEKALGANLEQYNKQLDDLNKKVDQVANSVEKLEKNNTSLNTSMIAMNQAIQNLGGAVPALTSAFQLYKTTQEQVNIACKAFAANPVGATIQLIAIALGVINTIIDKFKEKIAESDEATAKWNEAIAALDPIMKGFNVVLGYLVDKFIDIVGVITKGIEYVGKFGDAVSNFFGGSGKAYSDASKKAKEYAKLQNEINKEERKRIEERGKSDAKQGELREKIAQAEGKNKVKLLNDLKEEIKMQTNAEIALNKKRIALMKYQQSLGPTSTAEKKALAELEAETDRLIGEQGKKLAKIEKLIKSANDSIVKTAKETADKVKKIQDQYMKERSTLIQNEQKREATDKSFLSASRQLEDAKLKLTIQTEESKIKIKRDRLNEDVQIEKDNYNKQKALLEESINSGKLNAEDLAKFKFDLETLETQHMVNEMNFQTESYKIQSEEQTNILKKELEIRDKAKKQQEERDKYYEDEVKKRREEELKQREETINQIYGTVDYIMSQFDQLSQPQQLLFDTIGNVTANLYEEAKAFQDLGKSERTAADKTKMAMKVISQAVSATTQVVNSFMDAKQQDIQNDLKNGKITEEQAKKEFEKTKKVKIAMAIIGMAQGISEAIAGAMELGAIAGPIIGAINSAMVAASGAIQIAQIKKTTLENASAGETTPVSTNMSSTFSTLGVSANPLLNEDYDIANITRSATTQGNSATQDQRVYIVESDIQESNRRVQIIENETTF